MNRYDQSSKCESQQTPIKGSPLKVAGGLFLILSLNLETFAQRRPGRGKRPGNGPVNDRGNRSGMNPGRHRGAGFIKQRLKPGNPVNKLITYTGSTTGTRACGDVTSIPNGKLVCDQALAATSYMAKVFAPNAGETLSCLHGYRIGLKRASRAVQQIENNTMAPDVRLMNRLVNSQEVQTMRGDYYQMFDGEIQRGSDPASSLGKSLVDTLDRGTYRESLVNDGNSHAVAKYVDQKNIKKEKFLPPVIASGYFDAYGDFLRLGIIKPFGFGSFAKFVRNNDLRNYGIADLDIYRQLELFSIFHMNSDNEFFCAPQVADYHNAWFRKANGNRRVKRGRDHHFNTMLGKNAVDLKTYDWGNSKLAQQIFLRRLDRYNSGGLDQIIRRGNNSPRGGRNNRFNRRGPSVGHKPGAGFTRKEQLAIWKKHFDNFNAIEKLTKKVEGQDQAVALTATEVDSLQKLFLRVIAKSYTAYAEPIVKKSFNIAYPEYFYQGVDDGIDVGLEVLIEKLKSDMFNLEPFSVAGMGKISIQGLKNQAFASKAQSIYESAYQNVSSVFQNNAIISLTSGLDLIQENPKDGEFTAGEGILAGVDAVNYGLRAGKSTVSVFGSLLEPGSPMVISLAGQSKGGFDSKQPVAYIQSGVSPRTEVNVGIEIQNPVNMSDYTSRISTSRSNVALVRNDIELASQPKVSIDPLRGSLTASTEVFNPLKINSVAIPYVAISVPSLGFSQKKGVLTGSILSSGEIQGISFKAPIMDPIQILNIVKSQNYYGEGQTQIAAKAVAYAGPNGQAVDSLSESAIIPTAYTHLMAAYFDGLTKGKGYPTGGKSPAKRIEEIAGMIVADTASKLKSLNWNSSTHETLMGALRESFVQSPTARSRAHYKALGTAIMCQVYGMKARHVKGHQKFINSVEKFVPGLTNHRDRKSFRKWLGFKKCRGKPGFAQLLRSPIL